MLYRDYTGITSLGEPASFDEVGMSTTSENQARCQRLLASRSMGRIPSWALKLLYSPMKVTCFFSLRP